MLQKAARAHLNCHDMSNQTQCIFSHNITDKKVTTKLGKSYQKAVRPVWQRIHVHAPRAYVYSGNFEIRLHPYTRMSWPQKESKNGSLAQLVQMPQPSQIRSK